jgi:DNA polymerase-3 subunit gamma/tau
MIDEVHMLTNTAFNAMLKTLEEPPEYLKFVLATTDPQKVPVTVLSRCLQFNLRPMAPETVLEHLQHVLQAEQVPADTSSLRLLARAARGSMRDALSLTDQAIAFGSGKLEEATVRQMLGSVDRSYVFRLIEALAQGDGKSVVETSESLRLNGLSAASTLDEMSSVLQRMAVLQVVPDAPEDGDPEAADTARLARVMPADETQLLYSMCLHGRAELGLAPDEYAALTMVLLRLLAFKPAAPSAGASHPAEKKTLIDAAGGAASRPAVAGTAPRMVPPPGQVLHVVSPPDASAGAEAPEGRAPIAARAVAAPAATEVLAMPVRVQADSRAEATAGQAAEVRLVPTEEGAFWHSTVQQLIADEAIVALVRELALQSQLVARDTDQWLLRVERESLNQPGSRDRLGAALAAAGYSVRLAVEIGRVSDSPARRNAQAAAQRQLEAERVIFEDPFVQTIMRDFGAKVVPGTIKAM